MSKKKGKDTSKPELHVVTDEMGEPTTEPTIPKYTRLQFEKLPVVCAGVSIHAKDADDHLRIKIKLEATLEGDLSGVPLPASVLAALDEATRRSAGSRSTTIKLKRDYDESFHYFEHKGAELASFNATPKAASLTIKGNGVYVLKWTSEAHVDKEEGKRPPVLELLAQKHLRVTVEPLQQDLFPDEAHG